MLSSMVFKLVSLVVSPARADVHQQTLAGLASDLFRTTQALTSQAWRHHAPSRTPVARLGLQASRPNVHGRAFTPSKSEGAQTSSAPKSKPVTESARLALRFLRTATRTTATLSLLSLTSSLQGIVLRHYHRHISSPETRIAAPRSASRLDSGKGADILSTCVITDRAPPWRHELRAGHGAPRIGIRTTVPCKRSVIHTPPTPTLRPGTRPHWLKILRSRHRLIARPDDRRHRQQPDAGLLAGRPTIASNITAQLVRRLAGPKKPDAALGLDAAPRAQHYHPFTPS